MERATATTSPKRRLKGPERRALIEQAAAGLFAERGYEGVSLEEIAEAAGVSRTVIYDHYPSKAELHRQLSEDRARRLLEYMASRLSAEMEPLERLRAGIDSTLEFIENDRYAWRMLFGEVSSNPERAAMTMQLQNQAAAAIAAQIRSNPVAQPMIEERGEEVIDRVAEFVRGGTAGLAKWWFEHPETPRKELVGETVEFLWLGMERLIEGDRLAKPPPNIGNSSL